MTRPLYACERADNARDGIELLYWSQGDLRDARDLLSIGAWKLGWLRLRTASLFIEAAILNGLLAGAR